MKFDVQRVEKELKKRNVNKRQFSLLMKHEEGWFAQCCRNESANVEDVRIMEQIFNFDSLATGDDADKAAGYEDNYPDITVETLKRAKNASGLSQKEFCEKMGVGASWYKNVVYGYQRFTDNAKKALIATYPELIAEKSEQLDLKEALPAATENAPKKNDVPTEHTADTITQLSEIFTTIKDDLKKDSSEKYQELEKTLGKIASMIATIRSDIKIGNDIKRDILTELKRLNIKE